MLFLLIAIVSLILQLFLPWWIIAPVAFSLAAWNAHSAKNAFISGFLAIFVIWIIAGLVHTIPNENILANRVANMLTLPSSSLSWLIVLVISGVIGGLAAGFSALAGLYAKEAISHRKTNK
ncbi:hypothetical protein [Daejeonella sp.]|jgi:hypothetical protein|uniref:hypothetical protein n=1 Tax=Daejeonella sp. TaxID=2805397 RepID=UPI0037BE977D